MLRRLIVHASSYTMGSLLVTLAGVLSFPIFTRMLSVADYGTLNLISSGLLLLTGLGKMGVQNAIVRFHAEVTAGTRHISQSRYFSTVIVGMAITGALATVLWAMLSLFIPESWWNDPAVARFVFPVSLIIFIRVVDSGVCNILQALQRSGVYSIYTVLRRYIGIGLIIYIMVYAVPQLAGFYWGTVLAEAMALTAILAFLFHRYGLSVSEFCPATFRAMVAFGLPMIAYEISGLVLNFSDRYVIQLMMGSEALGQYSVAYNLCEYVQIILMVSFARAVTPIYIQIWEEKGEAQTRAFIEKVLRLYFMVSLPILAGITAVGNDLIVLLASEKYSAGTIVMPLVMAGMLIDGGIPIFGAGIYIHKQNRLIIPFVAMAAGLNVALNLLLIPSMGIAAAGVSTLICFAFVAAAGWMLGSKQLKFAFPVGDIVRFAIYALVMYGVVQAITMETLWLSLLAKVAAGILVYGVLILVFDRQTREMLIKVHTGLRKA